MAKQIIWSKRPVADRKEILLYWKQHNQSPAYAQKLNLLFKKAVSLIANHPHISRKTNAAGVRVRLIKQYLIFYEERESTINILTVWDGRRNPNTIPVE